MRSVILRSRSDQVDKANSSAKIANENYGTNNELKNSSAGDPSATLGGVALRMTAISFQSREDSKKVARVWSGRKKFSRRDSQRKKISSWNLLFMRVFYAFCLRWARMAAIVRAAQHPIREPQNFQASK